MLQATFTHLLASYTDNDSLTKDLWSEIEQHYSANNRHYHTSQHLEYLYNQLLEVKSEIKDWNLVLFTLFYHDIIYNATSSDNEEQSAELAVLRMNKLAIPTEQIARCKNQILATKKHLPNEDADANYFTDADLSILGMDLEVYNAYCTAVRKEYAVYPDLLYNPGRKKVLQHFLGMVRIFKTDFFFQKFEQQAKINLQKEFDLL